MNILNADDILAIHYQVVEMFKDEPDSIYPPGPRPGGMLQSAASRPHTAFGTTEKYPSVLAKVAALFHSLVTNHPFHNGNKRTAVVSLVVMLSRNNLALRATDDELYDVVLAVASNELSSAGGSSSSSADASVEALEDWLRRYTEPRRSSSSDLSMGDFLKGITNAGCKYRQDGRGGSWVILPPLGRQGKSIKLSRSTNKLDGGVIRKYLSMLNLSESSSGMYFAEFLEGKALEQVAIQKYRGVLQRLALT